MVPEKHLLANINGAYNAIQFIGDMVGNVVLYGLGAGMMPTGSAGRLTATGAEVSVPGPICVRFLKVQ